MTNEPLPLPDNVIHADPKPTAIIPHIHDYEDVCTSACPASPYYTGELPDNVEEFSLAVLAGKVDALTEQVKLLSAQQEGIAGMLATVVEQVGPTLDQISSNPMFKMMFGGK